MSIRVSGQNLVVEFHPESRSLRVVEADDGIHWVDSLWFAWNAFHPDTSVFEPDGAE